MHIHFDLDGLRQLLESYHQISGVKVAVTFPDGSNPPISVGMDCVFCRRLKKDAHFLARCQANDAAAFAFAMQGKTWIYRCHAGLYESVAPILSDGRPIACLMIGQIAPLLSADAAETELCARLQGHNELAELIEDYLSMPARSDEYLAASVRIMSACAGYIYLQNMISPMRSPLVARFRAYLEAHYAESLTLPQMAEAMDVCVTTLCTAIRAECGISPHTMLDACRMKQARRLLEQTDLPIGTVASNVGIGDYNYFSRKFKQIEGVTPSQFRRNCTSEKASSSVENEIDRS